MRLDHYQDYSSRPTEPRPKGACVALIVLLAFAGALFAHDLQENRATLVLRDRTHLSLTLYIDYPGALYLALAPQRPYGSFLAIYSSMKLEDFQRELTRAQTKFQSSLRILVPGVRGGLTLTNWTWPDARQVQAMLRKQVMQAMVDPANPAHEPPVEIRAEAVASQEISAAQVQFPEEFEKVLVVSYKPNQVWVERKAVSAELKF